MLNDSGDWVPCRYIGDTAIELLQAMVQCALVGVDAQKLDSDMEITHARQQMDPVVFAKILGLHKHLSARLGAKKNPPFNENNLAVELQEDPSLSNLPQFASNCFNWIMVRSSLGSSQISM